MDDIQVEAHMGMNLVGVKFHKLNHVHVKRHTGQTLWTGPWMGLASFKTILIRARLGVLKFRMG